MHLTKAPHTNDPCAIKAPGTDKPARFLLRAQQEFAQRIYVRVCIAYIRVRSVLQRDAIARNAHASKE